MYEMVYGIKLLFICMHGSVFVKLPLTSLFVLKTKQKM
jgi:hypothetical protein